MKNIRDMVYRCSRCGAVVLGDELEDNYNYRCPRCKENIHRVHEVGRIDRLKPARALEPTFRLPTPPPNSKRDLITVSVKGEGLDEIEKQLERFNKLAKETFAMR